MKAVTLCAVLIFAMLAGYAQVGSHDSDKARVLSLENAWNEAEKHKDARAIDRRPDRTRVCLYGF